MRIVVAAVGKPRDAALAEAIHEYEGRASRYWPLETREVRAESARSTAPDVVRQREATRLLEAVPPAARVVACDLGGTNMTSEQFAQWLRLLREDATDVAFLLGGALGLGVEARSRAALRLALAPWTLPHELARLVLAEQLYRAGTIIRGEPYHK